MNFVADQLSTGCRFRILNVVDDDSTAPQQDKVQRTHRLIAQAFSETTVLKTMAAENIREKLLEEISKCQDLLCEYFHQVCDDDDKDYYRRKIKTHLHLTSCFTSFKRWVIKDNPALCEAFSHYLSNE